MTSQIRSALATGLGAALVAAVLTVAVPAAAEVPVGEVVAYVWADNPTAVAYAPSASYAYNSTGGAVTVHRTGAGTYTVVFAGAAAQGGVVHANAYGSAPQVVCTVAGWLSTTVPTPDLRVNITCFTAPSTPEDSRFVASFTNARLVGPGRFTYLWADQPTPVGVRTLSHAYQYDSQGGPLSYHRLGLGEYQVNLPPNPPALAGIVPMLHVTAYNSTEWVSCVIGWPESRIVKCSRADGDPADTRFTLTYGVRVDLTGHTMGGFGSGTLYQATIAGTTISGTGYISAYPAGGGMTGTVLGTGSYLARMKGIGASGGHVAVTVVDDPDPPGPPQGRCSVVGWTRSGPDELVQVSCTGYGVTFPPRNLNVRISFTAYGVPG